MKTQPEIDATFVAVIRDEDGVRTRAFVTVEAKQVDERILEHQIREQVSTAFETTALLTGEDAISLVIPIVIKLVKSVDQIDPTRRCIYIAQYRPITRNDFETVFNRLPSEVPLSIQSSGLYKPHPPITGISAKPKSRPGKKVKP